MTSYHEFHRPDTVHLLQIHPPLLYQMREGNFSRLSETPSLPAGRLALNPETTFPCHRTDLTARRKGPDRRPSFFPQTGRPHTRP